MYHPLFNGRFLAAFVYKKNESVHAYGRSVCQTPFSPRERNCLGGTGWFDCNKFLCHIDRVLSGRGRRLEYISPL